MKLRLSYIFLSTFLIATFTGCSSYNLGTGGELSFKSIYIAPVQNESYAPQAQAIITKQIIQAFIQDKKLNISNEKYADVRLEVTLKDYDRRESAVQSIDTQRARAYDIQLMASYSLLDNKNGKVYFKDRIADATINTFVDDGLQSAEYQNMPILTKKLASKIRDNVISTW